MHQQKCLIHSKNKRKVLLPKDLLETFIFNKLIFGGLEQNANLDFQMQILSK